MLSGRRLDLLDPSPLDVEIEDVAHGLARVARWNGQTRGAHAFSVAQHSLLALELFEGEGPPATPAERMAALLHDAPEYVIGDMISPFKATLAGAYREVEAGLQRAIHLRFGLSATTPPALARRIKASDRRAAFHEATAFAGFTTREATELFGAPGPREKRPDRWLREMPAPEAEAAFLEAFASLAGD
ncbi:MAG: HD family hydrolase [Hyphomicrobiales bacterium]|nr:HD family hydrolase [Hyphomicrobiales bacterium]